MVFTQAGQLPGTDLGYTLVETLDLTDAAQRTTSDLSSYDEVLFRFKGATGLAWIKNSNAAANSYERTQLSAASAINNAAGLTRWDVVVSNSYAYFFKDGTNTTLQIIGINNNANSGWSGSCTNEWTTFETSSTIGTLEVYAR